MLSKNDIENMLIEVMLRTEKKKKENLIVIVKHLSKKQLDLFSDRIADYSLQEFISTQYYPVIPEFPYLLWGVAIIVFCLFVNDFSKDHLVTIPDFLLSYGLFIIAGLYLIIRALYGIKFSKALKNQTYTMSKCTVYDIERVVSKESDFDRNSMESTEHTRVDYYAKINGIKVNISKDTYWHLYRTNTGDAVALMCGNWIFGIFLL